MPNPINRFSITRNADGSAVVKFIPLQSSESASNEPSLVSYDERGNLIIGALSGTALTTGTSNTVVGSEAFFNATTGGYNTVLGGGAMQANTTGYENVALGPLALAELTSGYSNIAIGFGAGRGIQTGVGNTIIGPIGSLPPDLTGRVIIANGFGAIRLEFGQLGYPSLPRGLQSYSSHAAADADGSLPPGGIYLIDGSRALNIKPLS